MNNVNNDTSVILRQQLDSHNMKKYEFKKIEYPTTKEASASKKDEKEEFTPSPTQILSLIHISEPTRRVDGSRMPSSA